MGPSMVATCTRKLKSDLPRHLDALASTADLSFLHTDFIFSMQLKKFSPRWILAFLCLCNIGTLCGEDKLSSFEVKFRAPSSDHDSAYEIYLSDTKIGYSRELDICLGNIGAKKNDTVKIHLSATDQIADKNYRTPFHLTSTLPSWYLQGVKREIYYREKRCDIRLFWWSEGADESNFDSTAFYLDGVLLDFGQAGLDKLAEVKWGDFPALIIVGWYAFESPYRTTHVPGFGHIEWYKYLNRYSNAQTMRVLREKGVRVNEWAFADARPYQKKQAVKTTTP